MTVEIASLEEERISVVGDVVNRRFLSDQVSGLASSLWTRATAKPTSLDSWKQRLQLTIKNTGTSRR
jgi:hypothetical protein